MPTAGSPRRRPRCWGCRRRDFGTCRSAYGVDDGAWRDAHTAGVCFAIHPANGTGATLWRTCLDPLDKDTDRGPRAVSLDLPEGVTELALQTTCRAACDGGWAYWSKPQSVAAGSGTD